MIGHRVLFRLDDVSLMDAGVVTGVADDGLSFTTQRHPDLESLLSTTSELQELCMGMGLI